VAGTSPQRFDAVIVRLDAQLACMLAELSTLDWAIASQDALACSAAARITRAGMVQAVLATQRHLALAHYLRLASMRCTV
jgi:hypothetical protein